MKHYRRLCAVLALAAASAHAYEPAGTPDDWLERNIYTPLNKWGIAVMAAIDVLLFGPLAGAILWGVQMLWIPFWAAGVINGVGHWFGYRNHDVADASTNIVPWGILIGGEELHNNHHADPHSAKFKAKWYEFDIGWVYIKLLSWVRLAKVVYARNVSAAEFADRYYKRASDAAADMSARASASAAEMKASASAAAKRAHLAANEAARRASEAAEAATDSMRKDPRPRPVTD